MNKYKKLYENLETSNEKEKPSLVRIVKKSFKEIGNDAVKFVGSLGKTTLFLNTVYYTIANPLVLYKHDELDDVEAAGLLFGIPLGFGGLLAQGYLYIKIVQRGYPEALLIPVVTNITSKIYKKWKEAPYEIEK